MVQDWRFDDLTRTLGKATSRRQVLKGLVGGLVGISVVGRAAGVSAQVNEECDSEYQHCLDQADFALKADLATCIGYPKEKAACKRSAKLSHRIHQAGCVSKHCSCPAGTDACHSVLGFVNFGPTVCCEPSEECQHTWLGFAKCEPMCDICEKYDPDDPNEPCKPLECPECQICDQSTGQCTVADDGTSCGTDQVCCAGACTSGDTCDYCKGQLDGVQCGQDRSAARSTAPAISALPTRSSATTPASARARPSALQTSYRIRKPVRARTCARTRPAASARRVTQPQAIASP